MRDSSPIAVGTILTRPQLNAPVRVVTVHAHGADTCVVGLVGIHSEQSAGSR